MKKLKTVQVDGVKYSLPAIEIMTEKLTKKGILLSHRLILAKQELDKVNQQIIEIAVAQREHNKTTVRLSAISGKVIITFRESLVLNQNISEIKHKLGSLYNRFVTTKTDCKPTKELKIFLQSNKDPEMKTTLEKYIKNKQIKPNVRYIGIT